MKDMRKGLLFITLSAILGLTGCQHHCMHPDDPFENINRHIFKMNMAFDATVIKPPAMLYTYAVPAPIRAGINNVYANVGMLPVIGNDILQLQSKQIQKDLLRLLINTTLGIGGIRDVATSMNYPAHANDFGLTLAHWGNTRSPYIMVPLLGPSTLRDGFGMLIDYTAFTPYPYIPDRILYGILALRYIDLRSQLADSMDMLKTALDPYVLMRDAYLQHREALMGNVKEGDSNHSNAPADSSASLYVEE